MRTWTFQYKVAFQTFAKQSLLKKKIANVFLEAGVGQWPDHLRWPMRMANRPNVAFVFQTTHTAKHLCVNSYYNHHKRTSYHILKKLTWYPSKVAFLATGLKGSYKNWFPGWDQSNWWICKDWSPSKGAKEPLRVVARKPEDENSSQWSEDLV